MQKPSMLVFWRKPSSFPYLIGLLVAAVSAACSDDPTAAAPDAGTGGAAGAPSSGRCDNAADRGPVSGTFEDGKRVGDLTRECGVGCITDPDPDACTLECLRQRTRETISEDCLGCFIGTFRCGAANCLAACSGDGPDVVENCDRCVCGDNPAGISCVQQTVECTGNPSTRCE